MGSGTVPIPLCVGEGCPVSRTYKYLIRLGEWKVYKSGSTVADPEIYLREGSITSFNRGSPTVASGIDGTANPLFWPLVDSIFTRDGFLYFHWLLSKKRFIHSHFLSLNEIYTLVQNLIALNFYYFIDLAIFLY